MPPVERFNDCPLEVPSERVQAARSAGFSDVIGSIDMSTPTAGPPYGETVPPKCADAPFDAVDAVSGENGDQAVYEAPPPARREVKTTLYDVDRFYEVISDGTPRDLTIWQTFSQTELPPVLPGVDMLTGEQREALRAQGTAAAAVILSGQVSALPINARLDYVELCATPENNTGVIGFMDALKEVGTDNAPLVRLLQRTADVEDIPGVVAYAENARTAHKGRQERVAEAIEIAAAAAQRGLDPARDAQWEQTLTRLSNMESEAGERFVDGAYPDIARAETTPGRLAVAYAARFYGGGMLDDSNWQPPYGNAWPYPLPERIDTVRNLHAAAEELGIIATDHPHAPCILGKLAERERSSSSYAVPVGVELEITRQSLADDSKTSLDQKIVQAIPKITNMSYIKRAGVPSPYAGDPEIIEEFATRAARHYGTISREVQAMAALGVLSEHGNVPLHVTLGEIRADIPGGDGAFILARAMEATGWACTGERLRQPLFGTSTWASKGIAGLKQREPSAVQLGSSSALEFRTLTFDTQAGFDRTLRSMYGLGSALRMRQAGGGFSETGRALATVWDTFEAEAVAIFRDHDIARPGASWEARQKYNDLALGTTDAELDPNFLRLAHLLDEAATDPRSEGAVFQDRMQRLVIACRGDAMRLLKDR